jgi:4-hydroxybenzoate polyprenyltransferase
MGGGEVLVSQLEAYLTTLIALSLLAGWLLALRSRRYLGWLGLVFSSLAMMFNLWRAGLRVPGWPFLAAAAVFFCAALLAAARETGDRLRVLRAAREANEAAFLEMLKAEAASRARPAAGGREQEAHAEPVESPESGAER